MTVHQVDPLGDLRWKEFLQKHPRSSVFHTTGWLAALRRTYGYEPVVLTTSAPTAGLTNGIAFCRIDSWVTGNRLVSLPFADHCEPLVDRSEDLEEILAFLECKAEKGNLKYIEIRPLRPHPITGSRFERSETFCFHKLDLHSSTEELFQSFQKDSIQKKIRRAEREGLVCEEGRAESLLDKFYRLLLLTRRRHQLPPQPSKWFRNLIACLGEQLNIRVASKEGRPVASILTLRYKSSLVYKYGCSDASSHNLGGMALLFWKAIQEAKDQGLKEFDLGRSDPNNTGLMTFKDRWDATRSSLTYLRYPGRRCQTTREGWKLLIVKQIFSRMPDGFLATAGKLLYKHLG